METSTDTLAPPSTIISATTPSTLPDTYHAILQQLLSKEPTRSHEPAYKRSRDAGGPGGWRVIR